MQYLNEFLIYLKKCHAHVMTLEAEAQGCLDADDMENYRKKMCAKAEFLAKIDENAKPFLATFPGEVRFNLTLALDRFASGARTALSLDSVFYMSALLYPDDHKPGMPDNLMQFIKDIERNGGNFF
jgi:hypothetical protein